MADLAWTPPTHLPGPTGPRPAPPPTDRSAAGNTRSTLAGASRRTASSAPITVAVSSSFRRLLPLLLCRLDRAYQGAWEFGVSFAQLIPSFVPLVRRQSAQVAEFDVPGRGQLREKRQFGSRSAGRVQQRLEIDHGQIHS